ncbi:MAG: hypothetical protein ACREBF_02180 [Candidatus Micrarchaeales archaeon]
MVKVYKHNNKLVIYVPFDVIEGLGLKEGDEVDFFKFRGNSFIFASKADITNMIVGTQPREMIVTKPVAQSGPASSAPEISREEIGVLKKLDTLKYNMRTKANILKMLNSDEKTILKGLMKKKAVSLFAKDKSKEPLFSITKSVYDNYLMRKKVNQVVKPVDIRVEAPKFRANAEENDNVRKLEKEGFIVLQSEAEASSLSSALEASIRHGQVLGTRSFNKKFYIILRAFFDKYGGKIMKTLKDGDMKVAQVASEVGVDEDGVRAILYLLAESGDVTEKRRDLFTLA